MRYIKWQDRAIESTYVLSRSCRNKILVMHKAAIYYPYAAQLPAIPSTLNPDEDRENALKSDMAYSKCLCCNSDLRYPETAAKFKCSVCDTINDLKPHLLRQEGRQISSALTLKQLKRVVAECKRNKKAAKEVGNSTPETHESAQFFEPVGTLIDTVFGNWYNLNNSFSNGYDVSLKECGLAFDDIQCAYRILLNLHVDIVRRLMTAIEKLLKRPGIPLRRISDIRFLLIILENPLLTQHKFPMEAKYHHHLLKRIYGILSCLNNECHHALVNWLTTYPTFENHIDLVHTFINYRIQRCRKRPKQGSITAYATDWKLASAARIMALLFAANTQSPKMPLFKFYNIMIDTVDLLADYESWQSRTAKFAFCQYPFLISMGAKVQIMESDAKQQMEIKRREAIYNMLVYQKPSSPYLTLHIRRDHLIEDSLHQLAENKLDLKKSLRIEFVDEEGVDAGGLRKEWFLLLVRSLFDSQYGMFTYDEESNLCWFNPASFENEDQFFLVGTVLGLALYNSIILDIHLPTACYKKLLNQEVGLTDLGVFRPSLVHGFQQLMAFEGNVEDDICRSFVAELDVFGERQIVPLVPNGKFRVVNNSNRQEFVDLFVDFILNRSIERQFNAFKEGFYHVCGGNALSLFRPEEIELLIRGADLPLQMNELRNQTDYHGFDENEDTIQNFWSIMEEMLPELQRKLLMFVTGSDRIPATGTKQMRLQITCGGEDCDRLPSAHTCFNQLILYKYANKAKLQRLLEIAIQESQGFYVK